ncbi:MAG: hypothetical protein ABSC08_14885 [Bryobacteraceae bacterium]|jgi:hypothetical protein
MIEKRTDDAYQLGAWVGRKQAFAALAGRGLVPAQCAAAEAGPPWNSGGIASRRAAFSNLAKAPARVSMLG